MSEPTETLLSVAGLSLERLRNFCLVAEAGSPAQAARGDLGRMALFSRQLKELEEFFGVTLRVRRGRGSVLTEQGRRLAVLAQEHLTALTDFQRACRDEPMELSLASGNSLLDWLVLPQCHVLRRELPGVHLQMLSLRTRDIVEGLVQRTLDLGLIRADAVAPGLRSVPVRGYTYRLFVPRALASGLTKSRLRQRLAALPLATSLGGQFRAQLLDAATRAGWTLRVEVACASFTQAARAVATGACAGILPAAAAVEFAPSQVVVHELPFLAGYTRPLVLAWNPRTGARAPAVTRAKDLLGRLLG